MGQELHLAGPPSFFNATPPVAEHLEVERVVERLCVPKLPLLRSWLQLASCEAPLAEQS